MNGEAHRIMVRSAAEGGASVSHELPLSVFGCYLVVNQN